MLSRGDSVEDKPTFQFGVDEVEVDFRVSSTLFYLVTPHSDGPPTRVTIFPRINYRELRNCILRLVAEVEQ